MQQKYYKKAEKFFKKTIIKDKNDSVAINNLAFCYFKIGKYEKAIKFLYNALALDNKNHFIMYNLANAYKDIDELEKAETFYNKALKFNPKNQHYLFNKSLVLLKKRNYRKAWPLYDLRIGLRNKNDKIFHLINKNIYLYNKLPNSKNYKFCIMPEQGIGDQLLFSTMYNDFLKKYPKTFIFTDKRLKNTFQNTFKFNNFVNQENIGKIKELIKNKYKFLYAASLGKFFRNNIRDFSHALKLKVNINIKNKIKKKLEKYKKKQLIGISWHSESKSLNSKSINLNDFNKLFQNTNYLLINLQYGSAANDINKSKKFKNKIINFNEIDIYNDIESLIALIDCLDSIITIDNINVQIAGLLGKKTFVITPYNNEYILYSRSNFGNCDWYPLNKIYYLNMNKTNIKKEFNKILREL